MMKRRRKIYVSKAARQQLSSILQNDAIGRPVRMDDWKWMVNGRELDDWFDTHSYRKLINALCRRYKMTEDHLVWTDKDGKTTLHYYAAYGLAIYIDPHFESYMAVVNEAQKAEMWNTLDKITDIYIEEGEQALLRFWNAVTSPPEDFVN